MTESHHSSLQERRSLMTDEAQNLGRIRTLETHPNPTFSKGPSSSTSLAIDQRIKYRVDRRRRPIIINQSRPTTRKSRDAGSEPQKPKYKTNQHLNQPALEQRRIHSHDQDYLLNYYRYHVAPTLPTLLHAMALAWNYNLGQIWGS